MTHQLTVSDVVHRTRPATSEICDRNLHKHPRIAPIWLQYRGKIQQDARNPNGRASHELLGLSVALMVVVSAVLEEMIDQSKEA